LPSLRLASLLLVVINQSPKKDKKVEAAVVIPTPTPETKPVEVKTPPVEIKPAKPEKVTLKLALNEGGAKIFVNGNLVGETQAPPNATTVTVPYGEAEVALKIDKDGFEPISKNIMPNTDMLESLTLVKKGKVASNDPKGTKTSKDPKDPKDPVKTNTDPVKTNTDPIKTNTDPVKTDPDSTLNPFKNKPKTP